jgi:hypothetical protein
MEQQVIIEMTKLLEKTGLLSSSNIDGQTMDEEAQKLETLWMNVKAINARYDKGEAFTQVGWLMDQYNIQIDELMERITAH